MKLQGLGEGAARVLNASDDRLEGLLALVDVGWKNQVVEIGQEWQIRFILKESEEDIARLLATRRITREIQDAQMQLEGLRFSAVEWLCGYHSPACP